MKKLSSYMESVLEFDIRGIDTTIERKFRLVSQGSRHYNQTDFAKFMKRHPECVEVVDNGNDAPRGGSTGSYVIVRMTPVFVQKFGWYYKAKAKEDAERIEREAKAKEAYAEAIKNGKHIMHMWTDVDMKRASGLTWSAYRESLKEASPEQWQELKAMFKAGLDIYAH